MGESKERFPLFAAGGDYSVFDDFIALEAGREDAWALTLARLCEVMALDPLDENFDAWSPPDLMMCKFGSIVTIYAVKRAENVGLDVLALLCADARAYQTGAALEREARRRLAEADYWRQ